MLVGKFFENRDVFVTGGTGFIGKALIEKLLRACPKVGKVFVLIRGKKGKSAEERVNELMQEPVFKKRLHFEQPQAWKKVHAIEGDCMELGLGIKPADLEKMQNVSIIVHGAASVRFDDSLRDAILMNTRGTHELIKIAKTLRNLEVFVHVSTTYSNPDRHVVEEEVYPAVADWRNAIKLAETFSTEALNILNPKYSRYQPNTYTFTKGLAEQIINDYRDELPLLMFRPSIVVSSISEPVPGWADNFNGPVGLLIACATGIMRTQYGDPDVISDYVPVDICVRALIIAIFRRGVEGLPEHCLLDNGTTKLEVINCAASNVFPIKTGELIELGKRYIKKNPLEKTLWVPGGSITKCKVWNWIRFLTLHILIATLVDTMIRVSGNKPFLLKLQRRIFAANLAVYYFIVTTWIFKNNNLLALEDKIPVAELDKFSMNQKLNQLEIEHYYHSAIRGAREFLLKESPESSKGARRRLKIFQALHFLIQFGSSLLLVRFVIRYLYMQFFLN